MKAPLLLAILAVPVLAAPPEDAQKLMDAHARAIHKVNLDTAQKLDEVRGKYIAAGDTKNAAEVSMLIKALEASKPIQAAETDETNSPLAGIVGKWRRDHDGMLWTFHDTTKGTGGDTDFTMRYDAKKKEIAIVGPDAVTFIKFTNDKDVLRGESRKGEPFTLRRVR